jgi:aryl-alcohol dehydrogenase-like predicted oxidoreductase
MKISRREFLGTAALTGVAANTVGTAGADTGALPTRVLGRTGARVSILAMGGGSRFLMYKDEDKALEALNRAFDLGITYMDTAYGYGDGLSEERVGKVMKTRRDGIFLVTKINKRKGDEAQRVLEGSLKRLQTDHLDLIHVHSLTDEHDLADVEAPDGVLKVLLKLRDQKVTRFIGITSHTDPAVLKTALERHDFDCTQMALNAARVGMASGKNGMVPNEAMKISFEDVALPVARRKKMGVIAMKVFAQEALVGQAPVEKLLYYSLSLPGVTLAVAGMPKFEYIDQNVALVKAFKLLPPAEMKQLSGHLADHNKAALDRFFSTHVDA